jgi:hypothetical protein
VKGRIPVAFAATALLAAAPPAHAQFSLEGTYATGNTPYSAYAADFNADGRPDLATVNGDAASVSLFLRQVGGFAEEAGSPFSLSGATSNAVAGDFNGDGWPDLAISDFTVSGVVVALRNPAGGFTREANVLSGRTSAVGAGDFNQDGLLDLAVAAYDTGNVTIMLRTSGGFQPAQNPNYFVGTQPRQIAVADFDRDGRPDVAVVNEGSGNVALLRNTGGALFTNEPVTPVGNRPIGLVAGDFNADGRPDLAVSNINDDTVSILLRAPLGGFTQAAGSPVAVGDGPISVAAGDFDGNAVPEVAVAVSSGSLDVIGAGASGFARISSTPVVGAPYGVAVADFNGDTRPDAGVSSLVANQLSVLLSPAPPPTQPPPPQPTPTPTPPPLDRPQVNREVNVVPKSGTVLIKVRGSNRFVALTSPQQVVNGATIDARDGRVTIVAAQSASKTEQADFYDGIFRVSQTRRLTTVTLTEALDCRRGRASAAQKKPKSRKLWGDGKGKFRTKGRYSAATIRGTRWLVTDTCTTTRTRVTQASVNVRDTVRGRTVIVRKGKSYTARARR